MNQELLNVLLSNGYTAVPSPIQNAETSMRYVATIVNNMNFYGFTPSKEVLDVLLELDQSQVESYWNEVKPVLESVTASDRNMSEHIVYKNFPQEVLDMEQSEYWIKQVLIYLGCPVEFLTEEEKVRPELTQEVQLKVLSLAKEDTLQVIFNNLQSKNTAWNDVDKEQALILFKNDGVYVDISEATFKENGAFLAKYAFENNMPIAVKNATDVLRLAVEEGQTLRGNVRFRKMKRSERRFFLHLLENTKNLEDDMAMKKKMWKKFLRLLSPSDYSFNRVIKAYDKLYNNKLLSFEGKFKKAMEANHKEALSLAQSRVGFFINNIHYMYGVIGVDVLNRFADVADKATLTQLTKLHKYLSSVNERKHFLVAPNGNWNKLQVLENNKVKFEQSHLDVFLPKISQVINQKLGEVFPNGVILDERTKNIKMPTNDLELDLYGRGTSFDIPENISVIRTASYWSIESDGCVWFDNGFNFLNEDFEALGACCWNHPTFPSSHRRSEEKAAFFSGDPVNISDLKGRACQMIDLNIDKLVKEGARYAVWNVLSYNGLPFKDADDLVLSMQFCEDALEGNAYEPSRASMLFRIGGENKVKHVAVLDLVERQIKFLDLNIKGSTGSAFENRKQISDLLPKFFEHLECSTSVYDVFAHFENKVDAYPEMDVEDDGEELDVNELPVLVAYDDVDMVIPDGAKAFVMNHLNEENAFEKFDLLSL